MGQGDGPALAWLLPPRYRHGDAHVTRPRLCANCEAHGRLCPSAGPGLPSPPTRPHAQPPGAQAAACASRTFIRLKTRACPFVPTLRSAEPKE